MAHFRPPYLYDNDNPDDRSHYTFWDKEGTRTVWRAVLQSEDGHDNVWIDETSGKNLPLVNGAVWDFGQEQFKTFGELLQHMIKLVRCGSLAVSSSSPFLR